MGGKYEILNLFSTKAYLSFSSLQESHFAPQG